MKRPTALFFVLWKVLVIAGGAQADTPALINFQGRLLDSHGQAMSTNVTMEIMLYTGPAGGDPVYYEWIGTVPVQNSLYSFAFGTNTAAFQSALTNQECWLELVVQGNALSPRQRLTSVPYALDSARLGGTPATNFLTVATAFGGDVAGTYDNLALRSDLTGQMVSRVTGLLASNEVSVGGLSTTGRVAALTFYLNNAGIEGETVPLASFNSEGHGWTLCGIEDFGAAFEAKVDDAPATGGPWARQSNTWTAVAGTAAVAAAHATSTAAYALAQAAAAAASNAQARADLGITNGQEMVAWEYHIMDQEIETPVLFARFVPQNDGWYVAGREAFGAAMEAWDAKLDDAPATGGPWARQSNQWVNIGEAGPVAYLAAYNGAGAKDSGFPSIGMAWSFDGRFFLKVGDNPRLSTKEPTQAEWKDLYVAHPWLVKDDQNVYRLYYTAHANGGEYLAMSTSPNGRDWQDYGPLRQDWGTFPIVRQVSANQWQLWTHGQGKIWYAFGTNGIDWTAEGPVWDATNLPWTTYALAGGVISEGGSDYLFFAGNTVTSGLDAADIGLLRIGNPYVAMNDGNPILTRRTNAFGLLLQDVAEGARTISVANASSFAVHEPVQIGDMLTAPGVYQVQEVADPTTLVLKTSLRRAYSASATGCVVSVMYASICPRAVLKMGDHYVLYVTAYNLAPYSGSPIQCEYTVRAIAPHVLGPWTWDYKAGVILSVGSESEWDSTSAENISVVPVAAEHAMGAAMATFQAVEQLQRRVEDLERRLDGPP